MNKCSCKCSYNHLLWGRWCPAPQPRCFLSFRWTRLYSLVVGHYSANTIGVTYSKWASLVAQKVKNLPAVQETWVRSLVWEDPLEKGMATHSSILAWKSHGQRNLEGYSPWGGKETDVSERLSLSLSYSHHCRRGCSFDLTLPRRISP